MNVTILSIATTVCKNQRVVKKKGGNKWMNSQTSEVGGWVVDMHSTQYTDLAHLGFLSKRSEPTLTHSDHHYHHHDDKSRADEEFSWTRQQLTERTRSERAWSLVADVRTSIGAIDFVREDHPPRQYTIGMENWTATRKHPNTGRLPLGRWNRAKFVVKWGMQKAFGAN